MKNIISKEDFLNSIEEVQTASIYSQEFNRLNSKFGGEGFIFQPDCISSTLRLLKIVMEDKNDLIPYFCFDLNFGKKWKVGTLTEKDGTDIKLETIEDLYLALIKNE